MLTGNLELQSEVTVVEVGVAFSGAGRLIVGQSRGLTPEGTAEIAVLVENDGIHAVAGAAIGRNDFVDYILTNNGVIEMGLNGTGVGQFDRMFVDGQTQLDGALRLSLGGGYVPAINDMMTIISSPGGVLGQFTAVEQPASMPAGLVFSLDYSDVQFVRLKVVAGSAFSADFDLDGDVDAADLVVWKSSFGAGGGADADGDGDSDGSDFLAWQQQLGSGAAVSALRTVPEPAGYALGLGACTMLGAARRKRAIGSV
jgi:hypothetical protein